MKKLFLLIITFSMAISVHAQHSVARQWNEAQLAGIRKNFAKPTVHARNLFHLSMSMYDAWAAYDSVAKPFLLGDTVGGFICPFTGVPVPANLNAAREEAISYAAYRVLTWRYTNRVNPNCLNAPLNRPLSDTVTIRNLDALFLTLGYDSSYHGNNYSNGNPADLGNYIAEQVIAYGLQDGANELCGYSNQYYAPINPSMVVKLPGNPLMVDPNRWQPLALDFFVDQNGQVIPGGIQGGLTPEWGNVTPFALADSVKTVYTRDGHDYTVYEDPGPPPYIDTVNGGGLNDVYKWTHSLVSVWSAQLDPTDGVMWDVSPNHIGNVQSYPSDYSGHPAFYDLLNGGDHGIGYTVNPATGQPYAQQIVPRGDYARVLAEFWADGPTSETPPGHWFTILNYVHDHPQFVRRWGGKGPIMDDLEWNVKTYFTLGGSVHDAAICAWGDKGWYDSARPISALRYMADHGQSSDTSLSNYSPKGIPLIPGYIEVIQPGDPLDTNGMYAGQIKVKSWRGPNYVTIPATTVAGVDWILAANWWSYQRPTFVTPPFPGYISGHSTYSRTAAEVMERITGDEYFPGGMAEFHAPQNQYLVFEDGPSVDVTLQWAKYKDASDQCSLSRIWGGIHPPADDIPGRLIGMKIGPAAFIHAENYFDSEKPVVLSVTPNTVMISDVNTGAGSFSINVVFDEIMDTSATPSVTFPIENPTAKTLTFNASASGWTNWTTYIAVYDAADSSETLINIDVRISGGRDIVGNSQEQFDAIDNFSIDTENPAVLSVTPNQNIIKDANTGTATFTLTLVFDENVDTTIQPVVSFPLENPLAKTLSFNSDNSGWISLSTYVASYDVADSSETLLNIDVRITGGKDIAGNSQEQFDAIDNFNIDTENPVVISIAPSTNIITDAQAGISTFSLTIIFDENMDVNLNPSTVFPVENPLSKTLLFNSGASSWINAATFEAKYDVADSSETLVDIDVQVSPCYDEVGNSSPMFDIVDYFSIDTKNPSVVMVTPNLSVITKANTGTATFTITIEFDEDMSSSVNPAISFPAENPLAKTLTMNTSVWVDATTYEAIYDIADSSETLPDIDLRVETCLDEAGNELVQFDVANIFSIEMLPVNVRDIQNLTATKVYPNPVREGEMLVIDFGLEESDVTLQIFDILGQKLLNQTTHSAKRFVELNTKGMNSGLYFLQIMNNARNETIKFQVSR